MGKNKDRAEFLGRQAPPWTDDQRQALEKAFAEGREYQRRVYRDERDQAEAAQEAEAENRDAERARESERACAGGALPNYQMWLRRGNEVLTAIGKMQWSDPGPNGRTRCCAFIGEELRKAYEAGREVAAFRPDYPADMGDYTAEGQDLQEALEGLRSSVLAAIRRIH